MWSTVVHYSKNRPCRWLLTVGEGGAIRAIDEDSDLDMTAVADLIVLRVVVIVLFCLVLDSLFLCVFLAGERLWCTCS